MAECLTIRVDYVRLNDIRHSLMRTGGLLGASMTDLFRRHMGADDVQSVIDVRTPGDVLYRFTWNDGIPANIREKIMAVQVEIEAPVGHALPMVLKALPDHNLRVQ